MMHATDRDLVRSWPSFLLVWGLPAVLMIAAAWIPPLPRTLLWLLALGWMGGACLRNARVCGRVHCRYTGPFFLAMAGPTALHGFGLLPLGPDGWLWLGLGTAVGSTLIWIVSERRGGLYR